MAGMDKTFFADLIDDYYAECDEHVTAVRRILLALEQEGSEPRVSRSSLNDLMRAFHTVKGLSGMVGLKEAEQLAHQMESYLRALLKDQVAFVPRALDEMAVATKLLDDVIASHKAKSASLDISSMLDRLASLSKAQGDVTPARECGPVAGQMATEKQESELRTSEPIREISDRGEVQAVHRTWRFVFAPSAALVEQGVNVNAVRALFKEIGEITQAIPQVSAQGSISFEFLVTTDRDEAVFEAWKEKGITYSSPELLPSDSGQPAPKGMQSASLGLQPELSGGHRESVNEPSTQDIPHPSTAKGEQRETGLQRAASNIVRVDFSRLDDLMRMVGEMVISRARLEDVLIQAETAMPSEMWRSLQETNLALERQLRDLREGVMRVRMVPIGEVFERLQFAVYDLAREHRRKIVIEMQGKETEIDKMVVDRMMEPLLHLVRNAVSHGIEPEDERSARGKSHQGKISLRASTAGDVVVIEVEDDGRGLDSESILSHAREMGLIGSDEALDARMLLDVICAPGFSTRREADMTSGRGVGMAIVRNIVQELGGMVFLDTHPGLGSHFTIQLPLTLAIVDALIVGLDGQTFAVPIPSVREVIKVEPEQVTVFENNEIISYRTGIMPLLRLSKFFNLPFDPSRAQHVLVVGSTTSTVGIAVDRILGQREIVVRPLADPLVQMQGLAGATELGDGRVVLIINAGELIKANVEYRISNRRMSKYG